MAEPLVYHRPNCRLCESDNVELVLQLAACPPVDAYVTRAELNRVQESFPLDLYLCSACGHFQLLDVVSPKLLFGSYIYTTASSPGLVDYFRTYVRDLFSYESIPAGSLAIDIGSNDGTLLRFLQQSGLRGLGIDPARDIAATATASGVETIPAFFTHELARRVRAERGAVALVTANNVFAHSDQLGDMADGVRALLASDGLFVFEVSYILDMIRNMVFDFIYHEHLSHHSVKPLQTFLHRHGLELLHVERTPSKGGSIRCYAQLNGGPRKLSSSVAEMLQLEEDFGLYRPETIQTYAGRIAKAKAQVQQVAADLRSQTKKLAGYGASATGTVLIYHFELGQALNYIVDDNPLRQNRFSPGHHIPVVSSEALYTGPRCDAVLVLAWRFADAIIHKHNAYREAGGRFIIPLPELRIV